MSKYRIAILDKETNELYEADNIDLCMVHVAVKQESGLYQTHSFLGTEDMEEAFRMSLTLNRAIQDREFSHISPMVGEICKETDLIKKV